MLPSIGWPSTTRRARAPGAPEFVTVIPYVAPRATRVTSQLGTSGPICGSTTSAVVVGAHAQQVLRHGDEVPRRRAGQPGVLGLAVAGRLLAGDHLGVDVGLEPVDLGDVLAVGRSDPLVVLEGALAATDHRLGDDDPRVVVAEDPAVLLVARRVGGDLAQLDPVAGVGRVLQDQAVRGSQELGRPSPVRARLGCWRARSAGSVDVRPIPPMTAIPCGSIQILPSSWASVPTGWP